MTYEHKQSAPTHLIFLPFFVIVSIVAWQSQGDEAAQTLCVVAAIVFAVVASSFAHLVVKDAGDHLILHYGPLILFRKRIPYRHIQSAAPDRSRLIDGWGIHWVPGRGWTYNLWGFDCVELKVNGKRVRVGSDDVENLVAFLRGKLEAPGDG